MKLFMPIIGTNSNKKKFPGHLLKHERCLQSSLLLGTQVIDSERMIQEKLNFTHVKANYTLALAKRRKEQQLCVYATFCQTKAVLFAALPLL